MNFNFPQIPSHIDRCVLIDSGKNETWWWAQHSQTSAHIHHQSVACFEILMGDQWSWWLGVGSVLHFYFLYVESIGNIAIDFQSHWRPEGFGSSWCGEPITYQSAASMWPAGHVAWCSRVVFYWRQPTMLPLLRWEVYMSIGPNTSVYIRLIAHDSQSVVAIVFCWSMSYTASGALTTCTILKILIHP